MGLWRFSHPQVTYTYVQRHVFGINRVEICWFMLENRSHILNLIQGSNTVVYAQYCILGRRIVR
jgi:hypothetical protein